MKKYYLLLVTIAMSLCLTACECGSSNSEDGSETEETEVVDEKAALTGDDLTFYQSEKTSLETFFTTQLDSLAAAPWNPSEYRTLSELINSEELRSLSPEARIAFRSLLEADYCISMDNEARSMMGSASCSNNHKRLDEMMAERKKFVDERTSIGKSVRESYDRHQQMMRLVGSFSSKQTVNAFTDKYDTVFEEKKKKEAATALKDNRPVCSYLKKNLEKPNFASRRKDYCEKILSLYEQHVRQAGQVDNGQFNALEGNLLNTYGRAHEGEMKAWQARLDNLKANL